MGDAAVVFIIFMPITIVSILLKLVDLGSFKLVFGKEMFNRYFVLDCFIILLFGFLQAIPLTNSKSVAGVTFALIVFPALPLVLCALPETLKLRHSGREENTPFVAAIINAVIQIIFSICFLVILGDGWNKNLLIIGVICMVIAFAVVKKVINKKVLEK